MFETAEHKRTNRRSKWKGKGWGFDLAVRYRGSKLLEGVVRGGLDQRGHAASGHVLGTNEFCICKLLILNIDIWCRRGDSNPHTLASTWT